MKNPKLVTLTLTALTVFALICIPAGQVPVAVCIDSYQLTPIVKYELTFLQATQTQALANTLIVTAKDSDSNTVPYTGSVTLTSSDATAIYPTGNVVITNGVGSATFYFGTSGPQTITALDTSNSQIVGTTMTNVAPIHFTVSASANAVNAGQTLNITVTALDSQNHVLSELGNQGYGATLLFSSTDTAAGLPAEDSNVKLVSGTGTFNVTLNTVGAQTVTVTNKNFNQITATTQAITVNPATTPTETPTATPSPTETANATPTNQPQADSQPTTPPTSNTQLDTLTLAAVAATIIIVAVLALLILMKTGKLKRNQPLPPPPPPTDNQNQP